VDIPGSGTLLSGASAGISVFIWCSHYRYSLYVGAIGIDQSVLHRWLKKFGRNGGLSSEESGALEPLPDGEIAAMKSEIALLRE
jgi:transposase-like protein